MNKHDKAPKKDYVILNVHYLKFLKTNWQTKTYSFFQKKTKVA